MSHPLLLLNPPFTTSWMSFSLFPTIDRVQNANGTHTELLWRASEASEVNKEQRPANFVHLVLCPVNGRSCRRSSCTPAELYPPHELLDFIMLDGRVFDAQYYSIYPLVGAFLTRDWARFRLTKTLFFCGKIMQIVRFKYSSKMLYNNL